jgi:S-DNA-T family DNA segregation ATPase FtsK/SpoIIIE
MTLRTLIESLTRIHSPSDVHFYIFDFGSAGLNAYQDAPHVGAVIQRDENRRIKRLLRWLNMELQHRQNWLVQNGVSSLREYRQNHPDQTNMPAIMVIVDGLSYFKENFEMQDTLIQLAKDGALVGLHLVLAGGVTSSSMYKILNNIMTLRIGLQLDNKMIYKEILGDYPENLIMPKGIAGRGISKTYDTLLECQIASPLKPIDLENFIQSLHDQSKTLQENLPDPIPNLPEKIPLDDLLEETKPMSTLERWRSYSKRTALRAPIALDDETLEPIGLDLEKDGPHFLLIGPQGKGKTTALHTWILALAEFYPDEGVQFILFDSFKRSLADLQNLPHVRHYAATEGKQKQILQELQHTFKQRRNADEQESRPAIVVVIDDFQLLDSDAVKKALLSHAKADAFFGFHLMVAESSGNTSAYEKLRKQVLANASGALIGSINLIDDAGVFGLLLPAEERKQHLKEGLGYLVIQGKARLAKIALPGDSQEISERIRRISQINHDIKVNA